MFRWVLTDNDTGVVQTVRDPEGWQDIQFIHKRSEKFCGIFFDYSQALAFACGAGKELIDLAYDNKGSEADVDLQIVYSCDGVEKSFSSQLNFASYSIQFRGNELHTVIDVEKKGITQIIQNRSDTDIDLLSDTSLGGVALNDYPFLDLAMHSKVIEFKSVWATIDHGCCLRFPTPGIKPFFAFPPFLASLSDFDKTLNQVNQCMSSTFASFLPDAPPIIDTISSQLEFNTSTAEITWNFSGELTITTFDISTGGTLDDCSGCNPQSDCGDVSGDSNCGTEAQVVKIWDSLDVALRVWYGSDIECAFDSGKFFDLVVIPTTAGVSNPLTIAFSGSGSFTIPFNPGDKVWCYWIGDVNFISATGDYKMEYDYNVADLDIKMDTLANETTAQTLPIHESWSRICEGITDQTLAFKSEFFGRTNSQGISYAANGYGSFTGITDGRRIRGIEQVTDGSEDIQEGTTKKGIITNLDDMFDSSNTIFGIGLGIETEDGVEVVRVEEKDFFFDDTILLTFPNVSNMEMTYSEDKAFSGVDLGFDKWKPELKNGLDEPNTKASWIFTKVKSFNNVISFSSPYIAAMYAIETTRRKHITFEVTNDTRYDDDIFIIALNRTEPVTTETLKTAEQNENITILQGLIDPDTAYNLRFNLFSCLDRVLNQVTNGLTKDAPQPINFSDFEGNGSMKFQFNDGHAGDLNGVASENVQNTFYRSTDHRRIDPIVIPEQYTFTQPVPFKDYITICDNPRGKIRFSGNGIDFFEGWIENLEYSLKTSLGSFTIIRKFE